jgi:hypothetical protein
LQKGKCSQVHFDLVKVVFLLDRNQTARKHSQKISEVRKDHGRCVQLRQTRVSIRFPLLSGCSTTKEHPGFPNEPRRKQMELLGVHSELATLCLPNWLAYVSVSQTLSKPTDDQYGAFLSVVWDSKCHKTDRQDFSAEENTDEAELR